MKNYIQKGENLTQDVFLRIYGAPPSSAPIINRCSVNCSISFLRRSCSALPLTFGASATIFNFPNMLIFASNCIAFAVSMWSSIRYS